MSEKYYIWTLNASRNQSACQYYRIIIPMWKLQEMGYALCYEDKGEKPKERVKAMLSSDIVHFYAMAGSDILHQIDTIRGMKPGYIETGKLQYPPIVIYDIDDNTDFVHPMNSTFLHLGVRAYPSVELLEPGDCIEIEWPDGSKRALWEDRITNNGEDFFDIERNIKEMKIRHEIIRRSHGATVTTPALASYFKDVIGQPNTYIFPNTVISSDYKHFRVLRDNPEEIRIFWQGGSSHYVDWYPLKDTLKLIFEKYPNIKLVLYGVKFDWIYDAIPEDRIEFHDWTTSDAYRLHRGLLNIDINLCPLVNNVFNRCKSAIKWYEASIWNEPEATLAANVEPYHEIENGKTGLLYNSTKEFYEKLCILIENTELRKTLGQNAKKWVLTNRTPEVTIPPLAEFYKELKERQKYEFNPNKIIAARS